jgi:8-oxo-dGTP pyrophosphatase MutT (NUDIX family)
MTTSTVPRKIFTVCYPCKNVPYKDETALQILIGRHKDTPGARKIKLVGKYNGFGGKFESDKDQSITHCAQRETFEECGIMPDLDSLVEAGVILFHNESFDAEVHFFFTDKWAGGLKESAEMEDIKWHYLSHLPYESMMDADKKFWLPMHLHGAMMRGMILHTEITHDADMIVTSCLKFDFKQRVQK